MADLRPEGGDRAQLLIVAAVSFAIILIALALALNTAVYGDVHVPQTDSGSVEERGATQYQDSVRRGVTALLPVTGENETESDLRERFEGEMERWENVTRAQYASDGVATGVSVVNVTYQRRAVQDDGNRTFENATGRTEWTVASNVSESLSYQLTISNESLATDDNATFALEATGANGGSWTLSAFSTNDTDIVVEINGSRAYATNGSSLRIDVANGTLYDEGSQAAFGSFVDDESVDAPYELRYVNADNVTGTYELVDGDLNVTEANYNETGSPRVDPQIGGATVTVRYQSPELTYRTEVRVFAGETDA